MCLISGGYRHNTHSGPDADFHATDNLSPSSSSCGFLCSSGNVKLSFKLVHNSVNIKEKPGKVK